MTISVRNYQVEKGGVSILKVETLEIREKGITLLIGPNGAGKSTLLRSLCRLEEYLGEIRVSEKDLQEYSATKLARKIAWVPSESHLSFDITVGEATMLGRFPWHQGFPSKKDLRKVDESLERLGLRDLKTRWCSSLSSGEWQKVQLARAMSSEVHFLILDEPCSHLDLGARFELMELLKSMSEEIGVIMTSHDMYTIPRYASECVALREKQVQFHIKGPPDDDQIRKLFNSKN